MEYGHGIQTFSHAEPISNTNWNFFLRKSENAVRTNNWNGGTNERSNESGRWKKGKCNEIEMETLSKYALRWDCIATHGYTQHRVHDISRKIHFLFLSKPICVHIPYIKRNARRIWSMQQSNRIVYCLAFCSNVFEHMCSRAVNGLFRWK